MKNISAKEIGTRFNNMVDKDRQTLEDVLYNWNEAKLSEDGTKILGQVGRDGWDAGNSKYNSVYTLRKKDFINWLHSDAPFDKKIYGEGIINNKEWADQIKRLRDLSG